MKDKQRTTAKRLMAAALSIIIVLSLFPWDGVFTAGAAESGPIALKRINGSGEAFIYHNFVETKTFTAGNTYAFLDDKYSADDAVSALGAGAILKALDTKPDHGGKYDTLYYIQRKYGNDATVKTYVQVITPGNDFDTCPFGGLYQVPNSGTPTEYRYFCWKGGAYNCGPYYAYTYEEESIQYTNVSASLNSIESQGSENPEDYTVSITYDGDQTKVLDAGSYSVSFSAPNTVTFVISDSVGNSVTANFQSPLAVRYDGNSEDVSNLPDTQSVWKGNSIKLSTQEPTRTGYKFQNWKDKTTGATYSSGASVSPTTSLNLLAQWKDATPPTVIYSPTQVMTGDSDDVVKKAVEAALTITDNESVEGCTTTITLPANCTKTPGNKSVTVKVTDKAGNSTTKTCSVYVSSYVSFGTPTVTYTSTAGTLKATLNNPGTDTVTASGFVWGVMNSPSLTVNNGSAKTSSVVNSAGGTISVTASNLQKGVTYYARAYITAGGITYYSEEITIGLGLPAYGTFKITNSGSNTFTVTRTDGSEGAQTVYYRTVNGSAVGGTHFTHKSGTLTFAAGVTSQTITVSENTANTAYSGMLATAYSNANRTYSVEIYRVTGGGSLGTTTSATRTMTNNSSYKISATAYTNDNARVVSLSDSNMWVSDGSGSGDWKIYFQNNRGKNTNGYNFNVQRSVDNAYLKKTATGFLYRAEFKYKEDDDGYQLAWISNQAPNSYGPVTITKETAIPLSSNFGTAKFTATWETNNGKEATLWFPSMSGNEIKKVTATATKGEEATVNMEKCISFDITETAHVWFSAAGSSEDKWYMTSFTDYIYVQDTQEPQLVAVAPMAGGTYKIGDKFVVSLIFDEIVDSANSTLNSVSVNTSWGTAKYSGGANTNVLYFTGTVATNAGSSLKVNSITGTSYIKDMCSQTGTATSSGSGTTSATVNTATPSFTVATGSITNGTGTATIKVTGTQSATTSMSYVWSDSTTPPSSGWVTLSPSELTTAKSGSGLTLSLRKEAGSGNSNGKWYLHVKGVYDDTGYTVYKYATLDFGTASNPASTPPTLTVSADNTSWATSRKIIIEATGADTLKYRKSDATSWTSLSKTAASVTVYENGFYTFLLTAGDETITKTVEVSKIDRTVPTASIGEPTSDTVETQKSGVYTKLVLPINCADADSGVKTVQYTWTNSTATPTSGWNPLAANAATVSYTATEDAPTAKYLHIKVTDNVGYSCTAYSSAYTVISEKAVNNHTPTITLTGAPTAWQNDTATLTWELSNYTGKNYEVTLPNGKTTTDTSGEIWARQNDTYTVTVRDLDYGGENSAGVTVSKLDFDPPDVTLSGIASGWSKDESQTLTINATDSASGVGRKYYAIVSSDAAVPTDLTELTGNTITVTEEGAYYIYYKVYDNSGDDSDEVKRDANYTEGFQPIQIDRTAPTVSFGEYSAATGKVTVTVADSVSKLKSVSYTVKNGTTTQTGSYQPDEQESQTFDIPTSELLPGDNDITVTAVDNAGWSTTQEKIVHVNVVSVDITWGAMAFTYSDGTWNPKTHSYDGVGWTADETGGDRITVENKGEADVNVTYSYEKTNSEVSGSFVDEKDTTITESVALPSNKELTTRLHLSGKPTETLNQEKIGSVTVTIGGDEE